MRWGIALVALLLWPKGAPAADAAPSHLDSPDAIIAAVGSRGADSVNLEIYDTPSWRAMGRGLRAGDRDWLLAALAIQPGGDGAAITDLKRLLTLALLVNPGDVLELFVSQSPPDAGMCRGWGEFAHATYDDAKQEIDALVASLESVEDPALASARDICLRRIRDWEPKLPLIYGEGAS